MSILASKKSNYNNTTEGDKLKDYLSDVDQDLQNLFQMSTPITFGYGSSNNILVSQGGWTWSVSGYLGGWNVTGNLLYAGTGATYIGLQPGVGIWAGDEAFLSGAFSVDPNGVVKAHSGDIGGWMLSASRLYSTNILLDSAGEYIRTVNYASGALGAGWNIDNSLAEFNNIRARGKIVTSVFEKDTVSTVGGNLLVSDSDILNVDMASSDTSNLTIVGDTTFAVGDFLRIKDGVDDEWFQVSAVSSNTYTVARDKAGVYGTNLNPTWKKGTAVANFGTSGEGVIFMTASESNAPYLSIVTHNGSPWTTLYTQCRLGNLNGFMDYSTDKYGIAMGSGNANIVIDQSNGIRIRKNLTDLVAIDTAGNAYISGTVLIGGASGVSASTLTSISGTQLLNNGNFEDWSSGVNVSPDGWTLGGASATISRGATTPSPKLGTYYAELTRVGTDCYMYQDLIPSLGTYIQGRTFTLGMWVYATVADRARIKMYANDGGYTFSSYHTGDSTWQFLTVTKTFGASTTIAFVYGDLTTGDTSACFDGAMCVEGSYVMPYADKVRDWGSPSDYTKIDGGDIYAGSSITIGSSGVLKSGMTGYNVGTGWWIGDVSGTPKFAIGNSATAKTMTWDGTDLEVANIQSPDYVANTSGFLLSASSGLLVNSGIIQGVDFVGDKLNYAAITTSGTFTPESNVSLVFVSMIGGGGGGGGSGDTDLGGESGSGGGSGCFIVNYPVAVSAGVGISVTIGTQGTGGLAGTGSSGGNTIFGSLICSGGAPGGQNAPGGFTIGFGGSFAGRNITSNDGGAGGSSPWGTPGDSGAPPTNATGYGAGGGGSTKTNNVGGGGNGAPGYCFVMW